MKEFSYRTRIQNLNRLKSEQFDLAIIGGGINGAGIARDAVSRGLKVALIEANDFAYGTSSRSSKLIHGGIRYLENFEFKLVFEALNERQKLFEIAPHLVHPLRFLLPVFKNDRVGMFKMGMGMWVYDALALFDAPELHEKLNDTETTQRVPQLNQQNLSGSFVYSDAYMDDDRLVHETLRSAHELNACLVSYTQAVGAKKVNGKINKLVCKDSLNGEEFQISAQHVISTVGPWTDIVANQLLTNWKKVLRPTKGIHLTIPQAKLPLKQAVVMSTRSDRRIIFAIPRYDMTIIGTTDTDFNQDPSTVSTTKEDVDYLLNIIQFYFPHTHLTKKDIIASYAGVRPLVADDAEHESQTSREHTILHDEQNVTFVAGGKYTTYRLIAEQTLDSTLKKYFSFEDQIKYSNSNTKIPLNPDASPDKMAQAELEYFRWCSQFSIELPDGQYLAKRYGMEALALLKAFDSFIKNIQSSKEKIIVLEALHAIHFTMCFNLVDFYTRRTHLFLALRDHGLKYLEMLANLFGDVLHWSESQKNNQIQEFKNYVAHELQWKD